MERKDRRRNIGGRTKEGTNKNGRTGQDRMEGQEKGDRRGDIGE
jgi:hypothetical protein